MVDPRPEHYVLYHKELIAELKDLIVKEKQLENELERLYVRRKLLDHNPIEELYPKGEVKKVEADIQELIQADQTNSSLIHRHIIEIQRLEILTPATLRDQLEKIPKRQ